MGIKGQYLIFDEDKVLNYRAHEGHLFSITVDPQSILISSFISRLNFLLNRKTPKYKKGVSIRATNTLNKKPEINSPKN